MCTTPTRKTGRNRDNPDGRNHIGTPSANHSDNGEDVYCFAVGVGT
jgi:hypothetical protein